MKKLMIAAAIVCAAVMSQAAAVGWSCSGADNYASGTYSIFIIGLNGVTDAEQIQTIVEKSGLAAASSYAFASDAVSAAGLATKASSKSGKTITFKPEPATAADNTYTAFIFVQDEDGKNASYTAPANITLANDATSKTFAFADQTANFAANNFTVAPEPTSGLLLLLGVAGLALKRKRA